MAFEVGRTYSVYEFLDVLRTSRSTAAYRVSNTLVRRQELLQVLLESAQEDQEQVERFIREVRVRASLVHANIVAFYNAFVLEGQLVMTTELVEGPTLAERLEAGPLAWREAAGFARQALAALTYAHGQDVVHRDISPENIMLAKGVVKLSNFALAKSASSPQLTQVGAIVGNPRYISPEQVRGTGELDVRSDIYSLGAVFYEMLCGAPPFESKSQFEMMLAHVNSEVKPPSEVTGDVPPEIDGVVLKALAKHPAERYQTAEEFSAALEAASAAVPEPEPEPAAMPAVAQAVPEPAVASAVVEPEPEPCVALAVLEALPEWMPQPVSIPSAVEAEPEPAVAAAVVEPEPEPVAMPAAVEAVPEPAGLGAFFGPEPMPEPEPAAAFAFSKPEPMPEPEPAATPEVVEAVPEPAVAPAPEPLRVIRAKPAAPSLRWAILGGAVAGAGAVFLAIWFAGGK